jgi:antitoxin (DNA-binding transcriptional repressor) of toxin-antitoxin stability system
MCYMSEPLGQPARVGVRELRQNLSVYLRRIKAGETLEVTERGQIVARLTPPPSKTLSPLQRLIAEGRATAPSRSHQDLPLPPSIPGRPLSEILQEMRDEDDR